MIIIHGIPQTPFFNFLSRSESQPNTVPNISIYGVNFNIYLSTVVSKISIFEEMLIKHNVVISISNNERVQTRFHTFNTTWKPTEYGTVLRIYLITTRFFKSCRLFPTNKMQCWLPLFENNIFEPFQCYIFMLYNLASRKGTPSVKHVKCTGKISPCWLVIFG